MSAGFTFEQFGMRVENPSRGLAGEGENLAVGGKVRHLETESEATLLRTLHITGTTHAHVGFGDDESVARLGHYAEPLARVASGLLLGDEHTVTLVGASSHASPELMECL